MTRAKTPKACANLQITFRSRKQMHAIAEALKPELMRPAGEKAQATLLAKGNHLILRFEARNGSALRAIFSSYLRMLAASLNACDTVAQLERSFEIKLGDKG